MTKNRYVFCIAFIFLICLGFPVFTQQDRRTASTGVPLVGPSLDMNENIMLARSSADYRVTPGDVYTLVYAAGSTTLSYTITVDTSYRIRISNLGIVNGAGKTFMQLKSEAEAVVANNYPLSGVQLVLTQPAIFKVHVKGEVPVTGEISVWALTRLSSLIAQNNQRERTQANQNTTIANNFLTPYASLRDVSIRSLNGQSRVYDLFKAQRLGDLSQDPYLRPGDEITFNRVKRLVTINGEVERPGTYQLLDGENINELIEFYGGGFTPIVDKTRIELVRMVESTDIAGDKIFLTKDNLEANYALENYDYVTVPTIVQLKPVMFVEGAIMTGVTSDIVSSNRLTVQFNQGETYASLVRKNISWFSAISDTQNAYIIRKDEHISINLNPMLYDASYRGEIFVQENDVLIIPFRQYFITVAGSVMRPGRYPYIPDRDWEYYIALAGGFIRERNSRQAVTILDMNGTRMKKTDVITPETVITARTNNGLYYFGIIAPVITTSLSIVMTFLSIYTQTGGSLR